MKQNRWKGKYRMQNGRHDLRYTVASIIHAEQRGTWTGGCYSDALMKDLVGLMTG
jgi:hypothetical protein